MEVFYDEIVLQKYEKKFGRSMPQENKRRQKNEVQEFIAITWVTKVVRRLVRTTLYLRWPQNAAVTLLPIGSWGGGTVLYAPMSYPRSRVERNLYDFLRNQKKVRTDLRKLRSSMTS